METSRTVLLFALAATGFSPIAKAQDPGARLPLTFVQNQGQWDCAAKYVARRGCTTVGLEPGAIALRVVGDAKSGGESAMIRLEFVDCEGPAIVPEKQLPGSHNYFFGEQENWRTRVPGYAGGRYENVWPGIDIRVSSLTNSHTVKYDVIVEPGSSLATAVIRCLGVTDLRIAADGALLADTPSGLLRQPAPITWQETATGERQPIACAFRLLGDNAFGFVVPKRDPSLRLVVDPGIEWSTFVGGAALDQAIGVVMTPTGESVFCGATCSTNFPTTSGAFDPGFNGGGCSDGFVAKISADGNNLIFATYLGGGVGGGTNEDLFSVALDGLDIVVVGMTSSGNYPVTPGALDTSLHSTGFNGCLSRLSPNGDVLKYSTYFGMSSTRITDVIVTGTDSATIVGRTTQTLPVTPGAFQTVRGSAIGTWDMFVARIETFSGGVLNWCTYLGGDGLDSVGTNSLAVDTQGRLVVAGLTQSSDFPTTAGAYDTTYGGGWDAFVTCFSSNGTSVAYSTLLGGAQDDVALCMTIDPVSGDSILGGWTGSSAFPTTVGALSQSLGVCATVVEQSSIHGLRA